MRLPDLPPLRDAPRAHRRTGYRLAALACFLLLLAGCGSTRTAPAQAAIGVAYAGPATLNLRKDLGMRAPVIGTAKHGERLDVLETRRRFVRVRTASGIIGWSNFNQLLSESQMEDLRELAEAAKTLPSEGSDSVYDPLNVHTAPYRQSPSFFQIPDGGHVEVIAHRLSLRNPPVAPKPVVHRARAARKSKTQAKAETLLIQPHFSPPPPPRNLEELSRPHLKDLPGYAPPPQAAVPPPSYDDWDLVRTPNGEAGWVLARNLISGVPDEVAQYAEGHRITAYLPLGQVTDPDTNKTMHYWLWTTETSGQHPYEFDSFRVFVWSLKHHRYETAYIERNVEGYYPVRTDAVPGGYENGFSLVLRENDGKLYKLTYGFSGYRVQMISKVPYQPPPPLPVVRESSNFAEIASPAAKASSWRSALRRWAGKLRRML